MAHGVGGQLVRHQHQVGETLARPGRGRPRARPPPSAARTGRPPSKSWSSGSRVGGIRRSPRPVPVGSVGRSARQCPPRPSRPGPSRRRSTPTQLQRAQHRSAADTVMVNHVGRLSAAWPIAVAQATSMKRSLRQVDLDVTVEPERLVSARSAPRRGGSRSHRPAGRRAGCAGGRSAGSGPRSRPRPPPPRVGLGGERQRHRVEHLPVVLADRGQPAVAEQLADLRLEDRQLVGRGRPAGPPSTCRRSTAVRRTRPGPPRRDRGRAGRRRWPRSARRRASQDCSLAVDGELVAGQRVVDRHTAVGQLGRELAGRRSTRSGTSPWSRGPDRPARRRPRYPDVRPDRRTSDTRGHPVPGPPRMWR